VRAGDNGFQNHESIPKQGADVGVFDRQGNMVMDILDIQRSSQVFDEGGHRNFQQKEPQQSHQAVYSEAVAILPTPTTRVKMISGQPEP
jgi:hypothetical protein